MSTGHEQASTFLEGPARRRRQLMSPEAVPLPVEIADYGERATAFVLDLFIWFCATIVVYLLIVVLVIGKLLGTSLAPGGTALTATISVLLLLAFLVRNLYFIHFELAWRGATPGKRLLGLRVVDRSGGPLLPGAVIARNLTREMEMFMPLGILLSLGRGSAWAELSLAAWLLAFVALPFFNRDRLRGGDLIAGTMVIALPRRALLGDLVDEHVRYAFTEKQLAAYGVFELQVLEELLRRSDAPDAASVRRQVCDKICHKIAWPSPVPDGETGPFLRDFYTTQRAYLEREQLFGKSRTDKHQQANGPGAAT
jgi:uncharacterized RDD family membrane protein YckC